MKYTNNLSCRVLSSRRARRRGVISMQVVLIVPMLLIMTITIVQFGMQILARQTINASAVAGATTAARNGGLEDVTRSVSRVLGTDKIRVHKNGRVAILLEQFGREPAVAGNTRLSCRPSGPKLRPGEVRVTVCV